MQILGLTDDITPRFQNIGKLRKGGEKTAGGYGPDLDYFRFTSDRPGVVEAFAEAYGEKPRLLRVFVPHQTVHAAFPTWCEVWNATGLVHRCDGQWMSIWRNGSNYSRERKPCDGGHEKNDPKNDSVGRLEVIIPELINAGFVGYVTLETHSLHDILHISRTLQAVYDSRGDLRGVEFTLWRVQETISAPGWGDRKNDRSKVKKWLVKLQPSPDWVRVQLESARMDALGLEAPNVVIDGATGEISERPQLPAPTTAPAPPPPPASSPAPVSDEERKFFGDPPAESKAAASQSNDKAVASANTTAAAKPGPLMWHPNGPHVAPEQWTRDSWTSFLFIQKISDAQVKKALGGKGLVSEWLAAAPGRTPDLARATVLASLKTRDEWLTIWSSYYNDLRAAGIDPEPIPGDLNATGIVQRIDAARVLLLSARAAKPSRKEPAHVPAQ